MSVVGNKSNGGITTRRKREAVCFILIYSWIFADANIPTIYFIRT